MSLFSIDHHHYFHGNDQQSEALALIINKQNLIIQKLDQVMALTEQQFTEVMDVVNNATNQGADYAVAIAAKIDALKEEIKGGGLAADAEERILTRMGTISTGATALADSLRAMAADETDPVPTPVPDPIV